MRFEQASRGEAGPPVEEGDAALLSTSLSSDMRVSAPSSRAGAEIAENASVAAELSAVLRCGSGIGMDEAGFKSA